MFVMLHSLLKNRATYKLLASQFETLLNRLKRKICFFFQTIESTFWHNAIDNFENDNPMRVLASHNSLLLHHLFALY